MKLTAEACAYAMNVMRGRTTPLSRAEAQGLIAEAYAIGQHKGTTKERARKSKWLQRRKSLQRSQ